MDVSLIAVGKAVGDSSPVFDKVGDAVVGAGEVGDTVGERVDDSSELGAAVGEAVDGVTGGSVVGAAVLGAALVGAGHVSLLSAYVPCGASHRHTQSRVAVVAIVPPSVIIIQFHEPSKGSLHAYVLASPSTARHVTPSRLP